MNGLTFLMVLAMGAAGGWFAYALLAANPRWDDESELAWYRLNYPQKWTDQ